MQNKCIECNKSICKVAIRCNTCAHRGANNSNYKDGSCSEQHFCIDCKVEISFNALRCRNCANIQHSKFLTGNNVGKKNPYYKHGLSKNKSAYRKYKWETDLNYRLTVLLRNRLRTALKYHKKQDKTLTLLGCSIAYLKQYLSSKFLFGMSWENHGEWHIDHIKPCRLFDLRKKSEQQKCFHYTNLQPLWAIDNMRKHCINNRWLKHNKKGVI